MDPTRNSRNLVSIACVLVFLILLQLSAFVTAQRSKNPTTRAKTLWKTLDGSPPTVVARGGFSGLFPDSSSFAYNFAIMTSVPNVILWCDVQLTKDGVGICFPDIKLDNSSNIGVVYPQNQSTYDVDGVKTKAYFPIDFTLQELSNLSLTQGDYSRSSDFDSNFLQIQTIDDVFQNNPFGVWLNIQHDAFYSQHNLSMRNFVISTAKGGGVSHVSSPEIKFLQSLTKSFASTQTKLLFRFLDQGVTEPSTSQTYGSILKNLTFIKTFASGILVPKAYILPVDPTGYLQPHTSLVADAHKIGLEVYAADFANDYVFAYDYSYNPVSEYLSFIDNGNFSVDGVVSDFPITASEAVGCFAHVGKNVTIEAKPLIISHEGASGDLPGCTDLAYTKAISDGADVIDCPVQMSKDGVPFCLGSINLMNNTQVAQTFRNLTQIVNGVEPSQGIFSFSLNWADIQGVTPSILNPWSDSLLFRNPKFRNAGKIISLSDFLDLAKNATSLSGVMIKIENAAYLAVNQGLGITDAVSDALEKAGYNDPSVKQKVMIRSTSSSVLKAMNGKNYSLVYEVDETIRDANNATITDIKSFADAVVIDKVSVFPKNGDGFLITTTDIVSHLQSFKLAVYTQIFQNEVVSIPFDFFSDPVVQINSFIMGPGIDGVITDFPQTASAYKKNLCLKMKQTPPYMSPVQPGALMQQISKEAMPPAMAPNPLLTVADVSQPPLPPVMTQNATTPTAAEPPKTSANRGQPQISVSSFLSFLAMIIASVLLL